MKAVVMTPLVLCALLSPAAAEPVSALDLVSIRVPLFARLDPRGRRILTVIVEPDAGRHVLRQAVWRLEPGRAVKLLDGAGNPRWSPDGRLVAVVSRIEGADRLAITTPDGAPVRTLALEGVLDHAWSPDGETLAAIAEVGEGAARRPQLHLIDVATGASRPLTSVPFQIVVAPWDPEGNLAFSPDGGSIAFAGKPSARFDDDYRSSIYTVELATRGVRRLTARDGMNLRPVWSPDGRWIAFRTTFGERDRFADHGLAIVSPDGAQLRDVGDRLELGFLDGPYWYDFTADSARLVFCAPQRASIRLFTLDLESRAVKPLTTGDAAVIRPSLSADRRSLALLRSDPRSPWDVWRMGLAGGRLTRVSRLNPRIEARARPRFERIHWQGAGGLPIEGVLALPASARKGRRPTVVYLHGGPEGMIFFGYTPEVPIPGAELHVTPPDYYTGRGWAVFYPNFRGSGGYGRALRRAALTDWSAGFAADVLAGVDRLVELGIADPDRLYLTGSWRSGSTKVLSLLEGTRRFRAAASFSAYPDIAALDRERDDFHLQHHALFGGSPEERPDEWKRQSPIERIDAIATPLMLVHDEHDFAVRSEQSLRVHHVLVERGVPGELIHYRTRGLRDDAALVDRLFRWFSDRG